MNRLGPISPLPGEDDLKTPICSVTIFYVVKTGCQWAMLPTISLRKALDCIAISTCGVKMGHGKWWTTECETIRQQMGLWIMIGENDGKGASRLWPTQKRVKVWHHLLSGYTRLKVLNMVIGGDAWLVCFDGCAGRFKTIFFALS